MNKEKVIAVVEGYLRDFSFVNIDSAHHAELKINYMSQPDIKMLEHACWICNGIILQLNQLDDSLDRASRELGFVQGILWVTGFYSLEKIKKDNS